MNKHINKVVWKKYTKVMETRLHDDRLLVMEDSHSRMAKFIVYIGPHPGEMLDPGERWGRLSKPEARKKFAEILKADTLEAE